MKGKYTTKSGESLEVSNFDADNKIAYATLQNGESKWYAESEYSTWGSTEVKPPEDVVIVEEIVVAEPVPEVVVAPEPIPEVVVEKPIAKKVVIEKPVIKKIKKK